MALQKQMNVDAKFVGEVTVTAYVKVESVSGTKANATAVVSAKKSGTDDEIWEKVYSFAPDLDGGNFIKQAYEHLKTLPEFAGAADV